MSQQNFKLKLVQYIILIVFFLSGAASLIYQIAWQRLLTVYYGVGSISIALIVSIYMFGLGIGALFGGYIVERVKNRLFLYFSVEILIGCFGLISPSLLDFLGKHTAGSSYQWAFVYMFLFLSIPTLLMGSTLPIITKIYNRVILDFLYSVSILYFINTMGAALGSLIASYVIISFWGLDSGIYTAVMINFLLAALILVAKKIKQNFTPINSQGNISPIINKIVYPLVFITGFLAIGYEIVWFRIVGILVKDSPYAFSSMLSVYLTGIAFGSYLSWFLSIRIKGIDKKGLFYLIQFLIGCYVLVCFIGYYYLTKFTKFNLLTQASFSYNIHPVLIIPPQSLTDWYLLLDIFFWPFLFLFIPTFAMGCSFPLISFLALKSADKEGETVGIVYFFNVLGNVVGGLVTGFFLLPLVKTEMTLLVFVIIGICFFLGIKKFSITIRTATVAILIIILLVIFPNSGQLYAVIHGKHPNYEAYIEEGLEGIVATFKNGEKVSNYINGSAHGGRPNSSFYFEAIETMANAPQTKNVLVIGYGTGSTVETLLKSNEVEKITLVEINGTLLKNLQKISLFAEMLNDRRIKLIIDDGRRFLLSGDEKYDLVLIDPLRSKTAYSNNLYSKEFFYLIKQHLTENGIFMVWIDEHNVLPKTLVTVFEQVRLYKFFMLASTSPIQMDKERKRNLIASFPDNIQKELLKFSDDFVDREVILQKTKSFTPNHQDWRPVTEYFIGLINKYSIALQQYK